ncbi:MAG TPA: histidine kinase [Actinocrinis sp.]
MEQALARPPLLKQIPRFVWSALAWSTAFFYAVVIWLGRHFDQVPGGRPPGPDLTPLEWVAVSLLVAAPLGVALRWPLSVFGVLLAESAAAVLSTPAPSQWILVLSATDALLLYVAAVRPRRLSIPAAALALAAQIAEIQYSTLNRPGPPLEVYVIPLASLILTAWCIGNSIQQRRIYAAALRTQAAAQAVTAERLRIARELHDQVAHSIGVIAIQAGAAGLVLDTRPDSARTALSAIEATSRETLAGLRRMLVSLRRAESRDGKGRGIDIGMDMGMSMDVDMSAEMSADMNGAIAAAGPVDGLDALPRLTGRIAEAGIDVQVEWRGPRRPLPPEVDLAAFRIIQESVTNVVRHSGARHCRVSLEFRPAELAIVVLDEGRGGLSDATPPPPPPPPPPPVPALVPAVAPTAVSGAVSTAVPVATTSSAGFGIIGMRERVALLGGRFDAGPRPGGGFRVTAGLPG